MASREGKGISGAIERSQRPTLGTGIWAILLWRVEREASTAL